MDQVLELEEALLRAALRLPAEQHGVFLAMACVGEEPMRRRLEQRLQSQTATDISRENSTLTAVDRVLPRALGLEEQPGDRIGPYHLLRVIGQGGMGTVWMAEQTEPIRRNVALKVVQAGRSSYEILGRFEAERQALALMDHPNIAKVLDAGSAPSGRPFFVMELVNGTPLTTFCDEERLSLRDRVALFVSICQGVQHAHQKGVIHRDLKPSNVLIAVYDGRPVPKIIDFGVAKATGQSLTERTIFTQIGLIVGTLEYMSPEQAVLNQLDIDTRSDVYSLGVLLYELLTGTTPLVRETIRKSAIDEILRRIREEEPPRPSTRLGQTPQQFPAVSDHRKLAPAQLTKALRGDLDWIVMRALEKDRARRYQTANDLAIDLQRYLSRKPVMAGPPTVRYRFTKWVGRNKLAFTAASAVAVSVLAALALATSLWLKKQDARQIRQLANFLETMLTGVDPSVAQGRDATLFRDILDKASEQLTQQIKLRPDMEAEIKSTIGHTYFSLGFYDKAEALQRETLALLTKRFGPESVEAAEALNLLATTLYQAGKLADAEANARHALAIRRKLCGGNSPEVAESLNDLSLMLLDEDQLDEAERLQREALALDRKLLGNDHPNVAASLNNLASILSAQGKMADAEAMQREELALSSARLGTNHPDLAISMNNLALLLCDEHTNLLEAEKLARDALLLRQKVLGTNHPDTLISLNNLGRVLGDEGKLNEAEPLVRQALNLRRNLRDTDPLDTAISLEDLFTILQRQGKSAELEPLAREALAIREGSAPDKWQTFRARGNLGALLLEQKRFKDAEPLLVSGFNGLKQHEKEIPVFSRSVITTAAQRLVELYQQTGEREKAALYANLEPLKAAVPTTSASPPQRAASVVSHN